MSNGFRGFGIERESNLTDLKVDRILKLPYIDSLNLPRPIEATDGGGIAYDRTTQRVYYSDGTSWFPIESGGGGSSVESYGFIKDGTQFIPTGVESVVSSWQTPSGVYQTLSGWDLTTGVYTAMTMQDISVQANISWSAGVSNLGNRTLKLQHSASGPGGPWTTVKEVITQADPNLNVSTTQEYQFNTRLGAGESLRVAVEHDAPIGLAIEETLETSLSGFRVTM